MSSFENLRIVDNFYQTSLFFPMPTVIISTLCEDGTTNLGPYSLVQPYYVAGKDYYAMLLCCRNSSNTAQNILRNGKCALKTLPFQHIFEYKLRHRTSADIAVADKHNFNHGFTPYDFYGIILSYFTVGIKVSV